MASQEGIHLFWGYKEETFRDFGALPPEPLNLPYSKRSMDSPFFSGDFSTVWRAIEAGYTVKPSDCPPMRFTAKYGYAIRCPGAVTIRRLPQRLNCRVFEEDKARYGIAEVGGGKWPCSDSGFIASWIAGSEFVKIQTGIDFFFPASCCLYQGPLPNRTLFDYKKIEIMAGIEYAKGNRSRVLHDRSYGIANLNVIIRLPPLGETLHIDRGQLLSWVFPVPLKKSISLKQIEPKY